MLPQNLLYQFHVKETGIMSPIKNKNVPVREFYRKSSTKSELLTLLSLHFIYRFL